MKIEKIDNSRLATTGKELRDIAASDADWIVRSADDLRQLRAAGGNALAKLPVTDFEAFLGTLKFANGGVAGGCYKPLMSTLMLSEIFEVFAHFGISAGLLAHQTDSSDSCQECTCDDAFECSFDFWSFCSSLCESGGQ
ncbi:hypothetical protein ACFV1W_31355 [Kitasatospora sp. NPDC059648]|uniref:hypothetical protein n=1 Tax=Kitasatospora sp. NPDC059648 TaxID=3346894 RepID=UPI0036A92986